MLPSIGENIQSLRLSKGLSHSQMAKAIGVNKSMIGYYEGNSRQPSHVTLIRIADFFGVSVDYLLGRDSPSTPAFTVDGLTETQKDIIFRTINEFKCANDR